MNKMAGEGKVTIEDLSTPVNIVKETQRSCGVAADEAMALCWLPSAQPQNCDHLGSFSAGVANWLLLNWNDINSLVLASAVGHTMGEAGMLGRESCNAGGFRGLSHSVRAPPTPVVLVGSQSGSPLLPQEWVWEPGWLVPWRE